MAGLKIFVSGTMKDLPTEREQVALAIRTMGLDPVWAEQWGARNRSPQDECEEMTSNCDIYLGLYGLNYGWRMPPENLISATEFEWQTAKRRSRPMLIYHQAGNPDPEQESFVARVRKWQGGNFAYTFESLDDLIPHLQNDLSALIKESFRPHGHDDELLASEVRMCLEGLGYMVQSNRCVEGIQVPILAEYHNVLIIPQCLAVGCNPKHAASLIGALMSIRFSGVVYVSHGELPHELKPLINRIHCIDFRDLLYLAGPGRAEARLRHAAWEWRYLGGRRLLSFDEFERVSEYRRQIADLLTASDLAYGLRCSIQHGKNLPFWSRANSNNEAAIDAIVFPFEHNCGRRPVLRAGYALERLGLTLRETALRRVRNLALPDAMRREVLAAADSCRSAEAWNAELKTYLDEGGFGPLLLQQIEEPDL